MAGALIDSRASGYQELMRALGKLNREVAGEIYDGIREAAEPVRALAESYAFGGIRNIGYQWGEMRLGVTSRGAYIVPATRNTGGPPRRSFGPLLLTTAMEPALERRQTETIEAIADAFDKVAAKAGFH